MQNAQGKRPAFRARRNAPFGVLPVSHIRNSHERPGGDSQQPMGYFDVSNIDLPPVKTQMRVVLKAFIWKIICFTLCLPITFYFTGSWLTSLWLTFWLEVFTFFLYIIYEHIWKKYA